MLYNSLSHWLKMFYAIIVLGPSWHIISEMQLIITPKICTPTSVILTTYYYILPLKSLILLYHKIFLNVITLTLRMNLHSMPKTFTFPKPIQKIDWIPERRLSFGILYFHHFYLYSYFLEADYISRASLSLGTYHTRLDRR